MKKNMDRRGFTLVELLAVMVILISVSLVAVGGISASLGNRDKKECVEQQELAVSAAKIYFSMNDVSNVTVGNLVDGEYLDSKYLYVNGGRLNNGDSISLDASGSTYKYNGNTVGNSCS